ncbi:hypothetical protein AB2S62_08630 [Vibrio sp. NTOU-M3]|uniref:hypothetical protein n=1 Tax=Vibrio sp. NTOU-M3 TaxID=3234954 RepID=UPI00349F821E
MTKRNASKYGAISEGWLYQKELMALPRVQQSSSELISFYNYHVSKHDFYHHLSGGEVVNAVEQIPVIDKACVLDHWELFLNSAAMNQRDIDLYISNFNIANTFNNHLVFHSSGSSGRKSITLYNQFEFGRSLYALYEKTLKAFGSRRIAYIGLTDRYNGGNQWMYHLSDPLDVKLMNFFDNDEQHIAALTEFQPDVIFTKPSKLLALGRKMRQKGTKLKSLNHIISVGENLSSYAENEIYRLFGVHPKNSFSTTETGPIGFQSSYDRELELYDNLNHVEILDENGLPIHEPNIPGRLVITNLYNLTFPLIRYDLADYVSWVDGKVGKSVSFVLGRGDKSVLLGKEERKIKVNELALWQFESDLLQDCQFNIIHSTQIDIYAVLIRDLPSEKETLKKQIGRFFDDLALPESVLVDIHFVHAIEPDSDSSKTKKVVIHPQKTPQSEGVL